MKVLVVDDDPTAQKVLQTFLERSGYQPQICAQSQQGLNAALGPDAPPIIVLDWLLPELDGLTVCKRLRQARPKIRPYIIMLTSKSAKEDVATGLDAGADDFVSKPFNVLELQARLRVAQRTVEYQLELLKQLDDNEHLSQRNSLLGEIISNQQPAAPTPATAENKKAPAQSPADFTHHEIRFMLSASLVELRLALEAITPRPTPVDLKAADAYAWAGLVLSTHGEWLDFVVAAKLIAVTRLFEKSLGRIPTNNVEVTGFWAEVARTVSMGFIRTLKVRGEEIFHPMMSRAFQRRTYRTPPPLPGGCKHFDLVIENQEIGLVLSTQPCPKQALKPKDLHELDILAEQFPPREVSVVPTFSEGVILTRRFIDKLLYQVDTSNNLLVHRPTILAQHFTHFG